MLFPGDRRFRVGHRAHRLLPRHLVAKVDGKIAGIVPCYLKSHSQANMCSTAAGPTPMSAPVDAITRSCRPRSLHAGDRPRC